MLRLTDISLRLDHTEEDLRAALLEALGCASEDLVDYAVRRKSIDARKRSAITLIYTLDVRLRDETAALERHAGNPRIALAPDTTYRFPAPASEGSAVPRPVVIGAGPCGLFAALALSRAGFRPLVLERGKAVEQRRRDVARFWKDGTLDPESNVQFGEGGAGTFSDGKLNTQIKERHNRCRSVLEELARAGAPESILTDAKPHVGTDALVRIVRNLRATLQELGAEVRFESRVERFEIEHGVIRGLVLAGGEEIEARRVVLAIGHSARDTFEALAGAGVRLEAKPFSIGARIEHPQSLIDRACYGRFAGHPRLGAAEYKLVHHAKAETGRSAYTFCMCPGGEVIAAASEPGCLVTNGMSAQARSRPNANSALLVGVRPEDFAAVAGSDSPLAGVAFQRHWERRAFEAGGSDWSAPVQLVGDFLAGRPSRALGDVEPSYRPGVALGDLAACLPGYAIETMREAIRELERKLRGFACPSALLTGVETRSSSPVRIVRDAAFESVTVRGLYPAGEGAGYAGGILSSAVDGIKVAEALASRAIGLV